jgi:hypothetical protein
MKAHLLLAPLLLFPFLCGCQAKQLQFATARQARTVTDLYYDQVMNNVAMLSEHPEKLPYFSLPNGGQNSTQFSVTGNYTMGFDLLASSSTIPRYLGKYLLDKQTTFVTGGDTNIEQWNTKPTYDPDQILLMKYAYEAIFGTVSPEHYSDLAMVLNPGYQQLQSPMRSKDDLLGEVVKAMSGLTNESEKAANLKFFLKKYGLGTTVSVTIEEIAAKVKAAGIALNDTQRAEVAQWLKDERDIMIQQRAIDAAKQREQPLSGFRPDYTRNLHTGWFAVGTRADVPKGACYVGHCGKTYAWVIPGCEGNLADFALVILDITAYQPSYRAQPSQLAPAAGRASTR